MGVHSNGLLLACILQSVSRKLLTLSICTFAPDLRASGSLPGKKAHQVPSSDSVEAGSESVNSLQPKRDVFTLLAPKGEHFTKERRFQFLELVNKTDQKVLQVVVSRFWGEDRPEEGVAGRGGQMSKLRQAMRCVWRWHVKSLDKSGLHNYLSICRSCLSVLCSLHTGLVLVFRLL